MQDETTIKQFEDPNLSHFSYAIKSKNEIVLIDPSRNPQAYYDFAQEQGAKIIGVIETHSHADFVSSHLEIHKKTGAIIYASSFTEALYPHTKFDDGDVLNFGNAQLKCLYTPGHSLDSISVLLEVKKEPTAVFTGDTLFIGDCGRADLRETDGDASTQRESLARKMYSSLREKFLALPDAVLVYPAHGAGSLCGKNILKKNSSTMAEEKANNWSLQKSTENEFVNRIIEDQAMIPSYFPFNVMLNKKGAENFKESVASIKRIHALNFGKIITTIDFQTLIIDTRPEKQFKKSHFKNAINLMNDLKFETWLGTLVRPDESFCLIAESEAIMEELLNRIAKIGYETQVVFGFATNTGEEASSIFNPKALEKSEDAFTIVDLRTKKEVDEKIIFNTSVHIPLQELRNRWEEIPVDKPILMHCAGGFRSAAGSSLLKTLVDEKIIIFDLGEAVKNYLN